MVIEMRDEDAKITDKNMIDLYQSYTQLLSQNKLHLTFSLVKDLAEILYEDSYINQYEFRELYKKASEIIESDEFNKLESDNVFEIQYDALIYNDEEELGKFAYSINAKAFLDYLPDEEVLEIYEKYCLDNRHFEMIFHPIHSIEDHFGPQVQDFLEKNTNYIRENVYYTLTPEGNICEWWTEYGAVKEARETLKNSFYYVLEYYK